MENTKSQLILLLQYNGTASHEQLQEINRALKEALEQLREKSQTVAA